VISRGIKIKFYYKWVISNEGKHVAKFMPWEEGVSVGLAPSMSDHPPGDYSLTYYMAPLLAELVQKDKEGLGELQQKHGCLEEEISLSCNYIRSINLPLDMRLLKIILTGCLCWFISLGSSAQYYDWQARVVQDFDELVEFSKLMDDNGYMPANINAFYKDGEVKFSTIWEKYEKPVKWEFKVNMGQQELFMNMETMNTKGFAPVDMSIYVQNNQVRYAAIWVLDTVVPWRAWTDLTPDEFQARNDTMTAQNYTLTDVSGYQVNGEAVYAGLWKKYASGPWRYVYGLNEEEFKATLIQRKEEDYLPYDMSVFSLNGVLKYSAIWMKAHNETFVIAYGHETDKFQEMFDSKLKEGYALTDYDGYELNGATYYSAIFKKAVAK
jgi:hypothetical protein